MGEKPAELILPLLTAARESLQPDYERERTENLTAVLFDQMVLFMSYTDISMRGILKIYSG